MRIEHYVYKNLIFDTSAIDISRSESAEPHYIDLGPGRFLVGRIRTPNQVIKGHDLTNRPNDLRAIISYVLRRSRRNSPQPVDTSSVARESFTSFMIIHAVDI